MIKKVLSMILVLVMVAGMFSIPVSAEMPIKVLLNGEELSFDVPPQLINDRTMVPMRKIFESMGATVEWEESTQTIYATKGDISITMQIDNTVIKVNNEEITLDVPPQLVDSRTLVPVRAVAESLQAKVEWDDPNQTVIITKEDDKPVTSLDDVNDFSTQTEFSCIVGASVSYGFEDMWYGTVGTGYTPYLRMTPIAYRGQTIIVSPVYSNFKITESDIAEVVYKITLRRSDGSEEILGTDIPAISGKAAPSQMIKAITSLEYNIDETDPLGTYTFTIESTDKIANKTITNEFDVTFVEYTNTDFEFDSAENVLAFMANYQMIPEPGMIIPAIIYVEKNGLMVYPAFLTGFVELLAKNPYLIPIAEQEFEKEFGKDGTPTLEILMTSVDAYIEIIQNNNPPTITFVSTAPEIGDDIMLYGGCLGVYMVSGSYDAARAMVESLITSDFTAAEHFEYMTVSVEKLIDNDPLFKAYCTYMMLYDATVSDAVKQELAKLLS